MADTTTTTYGLVKPEVGASEDTWGTKLNSDLDAIDGLLDGTTPIQPNLSFGLWKIGGVAVTANAAELNKLDGVTTTGTELNYVDGVTSNIQTQLNSKQAAATALTTSTTFGGDVSGTYNAIVVANDSHTHSNYITSNADDTITTKIIVGGSNRNGGMYGTYDSTKTQSIWSMGAAYQSAADGTTFGNLYGLAYKHTNNTTGGDMAGGHQMVWCQNGTGYSAMGANIWTSGNVTAYSDARVKTNVEVIPNALEKVQQLSGYTFDRTDVKYDEEGEPLVPVRQTGVIAQEVLKVLPEAVTGSEESHYSVAYGNMVGLLIEAIKELKAEVDELKGGR